MATVRSNVYLDGAEPLETDHPSQDQSLYQFIVTTSPDIGATCAIALKGHHMPAQGKV